jgi:hypothetical protein
MSCPPRFSALTALASQIVGNCAAIVRQCACSMLIAIAKHEDIRVPIDTTQDLVCGSRTNLWLDRVYSNFGGPYSVALHPD